MKIAETQKTKLTEQILAMRAIAKSHGPLHSFWEVIFDVEAFLNGSKTLLVMSADEWIVYCEQCLSYHSLK